MTTQATTEAPAPTAQRNPDQTTLLRLATAGSVDDGKSTLIGRLLFDSKGVLEDQWASVERTSKERGHDYTDLSLLTDGLRSEREQGITIDVAYRYFATAKRKFIIADTPGHTQYTRNMVTGASTAHLAIVLVDARNGLLEQSRRHAFLSSLLGIPHLVLAVNKMDLVDWDRERFEQIRDDFHSFATRLSIGDVTAIPISALNGDNVVTRSTNSPWYEGPSMLSHLEDVYVASDRNLVDVRFPVQYVIRPQSAEHHDHRSYAGTVAGGVLRPGEDVIVLPSGLPTRIATIEGPTGPVDEAFPPMAVSITLTDDIDISRGDMIARKGNQPWLTQDIDAMVCWMADRATLAEGREYLVKHATRTTKGRVTALEYKLDINTLHSDRAAGELGLNDIGRVRMRTQTALPIDEYKRNPTTGSFILIDPVTFDTVGAGMVLPPTGADQVDEEHVPGKLTASPNVTRHPSLVTATDRCSRGGTVWLTGLSGSGKSSVAMLVEQRLLAEGRPAFVLDGDNLRHGLNSDLGFSLTDRTENLRRLAHVAALIAASGQVVLVPVISPLHEHRDLAAQVHADAGLDFHCVHVDTPLEMCESRDTKGLYARARAGEITDFTGVDSPYEVPANPALRLLPDCTVSEQADLVVALLEGLPMTGLNDHELAADLATRAGELLLKVREEYADAARSDRKDAGDRRAQEFLAAELGRARPDDAVLSEEAVDDPIRLRAERVWIIDPLDGTREFAEPGREDWAVHVALWRRTATGAGELIAGAVALPAQGVTLGTPDVPPIPEHTGPPRIIVSRTRPPAVALEVRDALGGTLVEMGSAGAKMMALVQGRADIYVHAGGQYEWDSAAPVAVARAAGLHTSRLNGDPLVYNQSDTYLPDLVISRPEYAETALAVLRG